MRPGFAWWGGKLPDRGAANLKPQRRRWVAKKMWNATFQSAFWVCFFNRIYKLGSLLKKIWQTWFNGRKFEKLGFSKFGAIIEESALPMNKLKQLVEVSEGWWDYSTYLSYGLRLPDEIRKFPWWEGRGTSLPWWGRCPPPPAGATKAAYKIIILLISKVKNTGFIAY